MHFLSHHVDISLQSYWGDLKLLFLGNSLSIFVVIATG